MSEVSLNADYTQHLHIDTQTMTFSPSPGGHVLRKRLHLYGPAESGQVTSIVAYPPGSRFPRHEHPGGEEILVLSGTFSDDAGHWPEGSYLLNPEGFAHAPYSVDGCLLFVKLRQYQGEGRKHVALQTQQLIWEQDPTPGLSYKLLHAEQDLSEVNRIERLSAGSAPMSRNYPGGAEIFILQGSLQDSHGLFGTGTWLRIPPGSTHQVTSPDGCEYYLKMGAVSALAGPKQY